jgi:hypothetical protein
MGFPRTFDDDGHFDRFAVKAEAHEQSLVSQACGRGVRSTLRLGRCRIFRDFMYFGYLTRVSTTQSSPHE